MVHVLATHTVTLVGTVQGHESLPNPSGLNSLSGSGSVVAVGAVQIKGTLRDPGTVAASFRATVTLRDAHGTLVVALQGVRGGPASSGIPLTLTYNILGGSGGDRGARGTGVATFQEFLPPVAPGHRAAPSFSLTFGTLPQSPVPLSLVGSIQGTYFDTNGSNTTVFPQSQPGMGTLARLGATTGFGWLATQSAAPSTADEA